MRLEPIHPRQQYATRKLLIELLIVAALFAAVCVATSCTVTTAPDGTVTKQPDYHAWLTIAEMIAEGVVPPVAIPVPTK